MVVIIKLLHNMINDPWRTIKLLNPAKSRAGEPEPLKKKQGAGAAKKFAGSPALAKRHVFFCISWDPAWSQCLQTMGAGWTFSVCCSRLNKSTYRFSHSSHLCLCGVSMWSKGSYQINILLLSHQPLSHIHMYLTKTKL